MEVASPPVGGGKSHIGQGTIANGKLCRPLDGQRHVAAAGRTRRADIEVAIRGRDLGIAADENRVALAAIGKRAVQVQRTIADIVICQAAAAAGGCAIRGPDLAGVGQINARGREHHRAREGRAGQIAPEATPRRAALGGGNVLLRNTVMNAVCTKHFDPPGQPRQAKGCRRAKSTKPTNTVAPLSRRIKPVFSAINPNVNK